MLSDLIDLPILTTLINNTKPENDSSSFRNVMCIALEGIVVQTEVSIRHAQFDESDSHEECIHL